MPRAVESTIVFGSDEVDIRLPVDLRLPGKGRRVMPRELCPQICRVDACRYLAHSHPDLLGMRRMLCVMMLHVVLLLQLLCCWHPRHPWRGEACRLHHLVIRMQGRRRLLPAEQMGLMLLRLHLGRLVLMVSV